MNPVIFDVSEWLNNFCIAQNLPSVLLDFTNAEEVSFALIQTSSPVFEKQYINGSRIYRLECEIVIQGQIENQSTLKEQITTLCRFVTDVKDADITANRRILWSITTAPVLRNVMTGGVIQYGFSATLTFKEK